MSSSSAKWIQVPGYGLQTNQDTHLNKLEKIRLWYHFLATNVYDKVTYSKILWKYCNFFFDFSLFFFYFCEERLFRKCTVFRNGDQTKCQLATTTRRLLKVPCFLAFWKNRCFCYLSYIWTTTSLTIFNPTQSTTKNSIRNCGRLIGYMLHLPKEFCRILSVGRCGGLCG